MLQAGLPLLCRHLNPKHTGLPLCPVIALFVGVRVGSSRLLETRLCCKKVRQRMSYGPNSLPVVTIHWIHRKYNPRTRNPPKPATRNNKKARFVHMQPTRPLLLITQHPFGRWFGLQHARLVAPELGASSSSLSSARSFVAVA